MRWQVSQKSQGLSWRKRLCLNCFKDTMHKWINIYLGYCSRLEIFVFNVRLNFLNNGVGNVILNVIQQEIWKNYYSIILQGISERHDRKRINETSPCHTWRGFQGTCQDLVTELFQAPNSHLPWYQPTRIVTQCFIAALIGYFKVTWQTASRQTFLSR